MKETFIFFWKGRFSQWQRCKFVVDDITYCCAEQYMMAEKARLFKDNETLEKIMNATHPADHKKLGREVKNFDLGKWNAVAKDIVYKGNFAKFMQNEDLKVALLATTGTTLVEASPYDRIWGIGMDNNNPDVNDRTKWRGTNWLGEVLTKVRNDIWLLDESNQMSNPRNHRLNVIERAQNQAKNEIVK